jgi:acyl carrier protein
MDEKLKELTALVLNIDLDELSDDASPESLSSWDSVAHLTLISSIEADFKINIEPEEIMLMMKDYGSLKKIILDKLNT